MGTKSNSCRRGFVGCVVMERSNGAVDEKKFGFRGFTERINIFLVSLMGVTSMSYTGSPEIVQNTFFYYLWGPGSI